MKKLFAIFAVLGLSFGLVACDYLKENGKNVPPINTDHDGGDR